MTLRIKKNLAYHKLSPSVKKEQGKSCSGQGTTETFSRRSDLERLKRRQQTQSPLEGAFGADGTLVKVPVSWLNPECPLASGPSGFVIQWAKSKTMPLILLP